jgi:type IV pilus assembly protein PilE
MSKSLGSRKRASFGFTLIELMVTVAIVTILATIAVTSYSSQIQKSRRTEAKSALLDLAGREERLFSTANTYSDKQTFLGYASSGNAAVTNMDFGNHYYQLTVVVTAGPPATYLLTATPVNAQASDTTCGSFSVNQLGVQGVSGTGTVASCWGD